MLHVICINSLTHSLCLSNPRRREIEDLKNQVTALQQQQDERRPPWRVPQPMPGPPSSQQYAFAAARDAATGPAEEPATAEPEASNVVAAAATAEVAAEEAAPAHEAAAPAHEAAASAHEATVPAPEEAAAAHEAAAAEEAAPAEEEAPAGTCWQSYGRQGWSTRQWGTASYRWCKRCKKKTYVSKGWCDTCGWLPRKGKGKGGCHGISNKGAMCHRKLL